MPPAKLASTLLLCLVATSLGCSTSRPGPQHTSLCPDCRIEVRESIPLPTSGDQTIARLNQSWEILEHTCPRCELASAAFFRGGRYIDPCPATEAGAPQSEALPPAAQLVLADAPMARP